MSKIDSNAQEKLIAQHALKALDVFNALPIPLVRKCLEINAEPSDASAAIKYLIHERLVNYDKATNSINKVYGFEPDIRKSAALGVYLTLAADERGNVLRARYPFDYAFEIGIRIYPLIDYDKDGPQKLNFLRWIKMPHSDEYIVTPVIMIVNDEIDMLRETNKDGELYLIPKEKFIIASVDLTSDEVDQEYLKASCMEYSAGLKRTRKEEISMEILLSAKQKDITGQPRVKREKVEITAEELRVIREIQEALEAEKFAKPFESEDV